MARRLALCDEISSSPFAGSIFKVSTLRGARVLEGCVQLCVCLLLRNICRNRRVQPRSGPPLDGVHSGSKSGSAGLPTIFRNCIVSIIIEYDTRLLTRGTGKRSAQFACLGLGMAGKM